MENQKEQIIKQIKNIIKAEEETFVNVDLGAFTGAIFIKDSNDRYKDIMSKIVEIDDILTNVLDGDILNTQIDIQFNGEVQELHIRITFEFDN